MLWYQGYSLRNFDLNLSGRTQYVSNNGTNSDCMNFTYGVPQGSVFKFAGIFKLGCACYFFEHIKLPVSTNLQVVTR